jgi:hypothetical protein
MAMAKNSDSQECFRYHQLVTLIAGAKKAALPWSEQPE